MRADQLELVVAAVAGSGAVVLLAAVLARWASLVPWAVALTGAAYGLSLVLGDEAIDSLAPVYAVGLLVVAELAYWALERSAVEDNRELRLRRAAAVAAAGTASLLAAALALVVSDAAITGGLGLEVAGVVAASAALALVTGLAWRHARSAA